MVHSRTLSRFHPGLSLGLLAVVVISACAPAATTAPTQTAAPATPTPLIAATQTPETAVQPTVQAEAATLTPAPVAAATSRGPDLEATDPTTVSLASGGLQLVEFFRFT